MRELYRLRQFEKRALTIHRNAEKLFSDMMDHFGPEGMIGGDNATDFIDNVVEEASTLCSALERAIRLQKERRHD